MAQMMTSRGEWIHNLQHTHTHWGTVNSQRLVVVEGGGGLEEVCVTQ